jgi:enoyl-CoA hydratase/carnithine racemase
MHMIRPFEEYSKAYPNVDIQRTTDGVLELRLHTDNGPLLFGEGPHGQLVNLYTEIAGDVDNKIVILTGTGDWFISGMKASELPSTTEVKGAGHHKADVGRWAELHYTAKRIMQAQLDIEVPMIAAINGPIGTHSDQALLCDIVLAADTASFRDVVHFPAGLLPGDGIHALYGEIMGLNRMRYFMLTGQEINAQQALEWGLVNEVMPVEKLMPRARELAQAILEKPPLVVRLTRQVLVQDLKKRMLDEVGYGQGLEALAATEYFPSRSGEAMKPS